MRASLRSMRGAPLLRSPCKHINVEARGGTVPVSECMRFTRQRLQRICGLLSVQVMCWDLDAVMSAGSKKGAIQLLGDFEGEVTCIAVGGGPAGYWLATADGSTCNVW
jgi:hypothetical protein